MRPTIPTVGRVAVQVMTPDTPRYCEALGAVAPV
jgi:hypothetical protein